MHDSVWIMSSSGSGQCRVVVIGAGVIGLSVATHLTDRLGEKVDVTVFADK